MTRWRDYFIFSMTGSPHAIEARNHCKSFWSHEQEQRVFTTQRYVPVEICEIVLGCMTTKADASAVRELSSQLIPSAPVTQLKRDDLEWPGILQR